jgi:hypothetical protein
MTVYHRHMTQRVSTDPYWRNNCSAYSGAMLINDSTLGGLLGITGRYVREKSSEPIPDPQSPGLNIGQIRSVASGLRVPLYDKQGRPWSELVTALEEGRRVGLQLDYGELPAVSKCQAQGDFGHMIVIAHVRPDGIGMPGSDPLCTGVRVYRASELRHAAEVFARNTGLSSGVRWCTTRRIPEVK